MTDDNAGDKNETRELQNLRTKEPVNSGTRKLRNQKLDATNITNMDNQHNEEELTPQQSLKLISKILDKVEDDELRKIAKKRTNFKMQLAICIATNAFLIGVWYFTSGPYSYFWPKWAILGWGIGVIFSFFDAYLNNSLFSEDKEFEKLKRKARQEENK